MGRPLALQAACLRPWAPRVKDSCVMIAPTFYWGNTALSVANALRQAQEIIVPFTVGVSLKEWTIAIVANTDIRTLPIHHRVEGMDLRSDKIRDLITAQFPPSTTNVRDAVIRIVSGSLVDATDLVISHAETFLTKRKAELDPSNPMCFLKARVETRNSSEFCARPTIAERYRSEAVGVGPLAASLSASQIESFP